jgi:hypothetical protein
MPAESEHGRLLDQARALAHRAVGRRGRAVELGAPPTWPKAEVRRVRRQAWKMSVASMRTRIVTPLALTVAAVALVVVAQASVLLVLILFVLLGGFWCWRMTGSGRAVTQKWDRWARGRHTLERELRLLDSSWRLLWDRRVDALPGPVTIAVGPSGVWILWWVEPVMTVQLSDERTSAAAEQVAEFSGLPTQLHAWLERQSAAEIRELVHGIACAPVHASADDVNQAAEMLDAALLQEPVEIRAARWVGGS